MAGNLHLFFKRLTAYKQTACTGHSSVSLDVFLSAKELKNRNFAAFAHARSAFGMGKRVAVTARPFSLNAKAP